MKSDFEIARDKDFGVYGFSEVFRNMEGCRCLWKVFGSKEKFLSVLKSQKVRVSRKKWIFWVNHRRNEITIYRNYLRECDRRTLYLDCIHEMVHIRQLEEGRDLWDEKFAYVDRPTEIEAYIVAAREGKRIGMTSKQIASYLEVPWASSEENDRLVKNILKNI